MPTVKMSDEILEEIEIKICSDSKSDSEPEDEAYRTCVTELLNAYKERPILWDKKHPDYPKNHLREKSFQDLYNQSYVAYFPNHLVDQMKIKIETLRTSFMRQFKKVLKSAQGKNDPYVPELFYFEQFLFILDDSQLELYNMIKNHIDIEGIADSSLKSKYFDEIASDKDPFLEDKEMILNLIAAYKEYPVLWDNQHFEHDVHHVREQYLEEVYSKFKASHPKYSMKQMKETWTNLINFYKHRFAKVQADNQTNQFYDPGLFCYNELSFLNLEWDEETGHVRPEQKKSRYQKFVREFIAIFKKFRILWDTNHPEYVVHHEKSDFKILAFNELYMKYDEYYPGVTMEQVKCKLENLKTAFKRRWHAVQKAKTEDKEYKPNLFYYNDMLFCVGEICESDGDSKNIVETVNNSLELAEIKPKTEWPKTVKYGPQNEDETAVLIRLMKNYPELYVKKPGSKLKKMRAYKGITMDLMSECDKKFKTEEVSKRIESLKSQYRKVYKKYKSKGDKPSCGPTLWSIFEQMDEFMPKSGRKLRAKKNKKRYIEQDSGSDMHMEEECEENQLSKENSDVENVDTTIENMSTDSKNVRETQPKEEKEDEDNLDAELIQLRVTIATKLRDMPDDQRQYAEHLISEVMYAGLMKKLKVGSNLKF